MITLSNIQMITLYNKYIVYRLLQKIVLRDWRDHVLIQRPGGTREWPIGSMPKIALNL